MKIEEGFSEKCSSLVDYKKLTEDFVYGINLVFSDTKNFPNYKGGRFMLRYEKFEGCNYCFFYFEENKSKYIICRIELPIDNNENDFHEMVYKRILTSAFYPNDEIGTLKDDETNLPIIVISYDTLSKSGLDKYKEWIELTSNQIKNK